MTMSAQVDRKPRDNEQLKLSGSSVVPTKAKDITKTYAWLFTLSKNVGSDALEAALMSGASKIDGDYYYVRGFCDERQAMRNFRVDRIKEVPALLNEAAVIKPVDYNLPDYDKAVFRMFDTDKPIEVELLCNVNMMKYLIDNFGADFESEVIDENAFKARIFVCTSTTFYRWVFGFKGSIKIVGPEPVRTEYQTMLNDAINDCIQEY